MRALASVLLFRALRQRFIALGEPAARGPRAEARRSLGALAGIGAGFASAGRKKRARIRQSFFGKLDESSASAAANMGDGRPRGRGVHAA